MADHKIVFGPVVEGQPWMPICVVCNQSICLDGYPERFDGEWMHLYDWRKKNEPAKTITLTQAELNVKLIDSYNHGFADYVREMRKNQTKSPGE